MANLIGEGFPSFVVSQIEKRQSIYGSINRSNAQLEYLNNRNGWCKLVSSVNIDTPLRGITDTGNELARKYVLFNGTSPTTTGIGGLSGYGLGGTNFGINPMPGIISAEIKTENMGSLKSATIQIKANNRNQFDIIDILYMRLGYSVLLEWGNSNYFNNDGSYEPSNPHSLSNSFINGSTGTEYQDIFKTIDERRKASCGNYDAIVGKVVNFTWSFEKDGTYNCTVMVKSMGDILESLKSNTLLPEIKANTDPEEEENEGEEEATEPTSEEVIKSFRNTHEIGKKFYSLQKLIAKGTVGEAGITPLYSSKKNVIAFKQTYLGNDGGEGVDQYYVRLGYFLRFVQKALIPKVDDKQVRLIEIDTETDSNLIYVLGRQVSNNPSICLFKVDVPNGSEIVSFAPGVDEFIYSEINKNRYGKIMNVYFNMTYILNQLDSLKDTDTGKVSLYDLINCLCEGFNNATGNFNQLYPAVDADRNKIIITDQTVCPDIKDLLDIQLRSTALATFDVYGYYYSNSNNASSAGFIRDLSFQTTVSPNLATMITIGATSNGYIPGQDSTALSRMNAGLTDRFKKKVNLEQTSPIPPSKESLFEDYKESILSYQTFVSQLGGSTPTWNQEAIDAFSNAASSFYEYDQAKQTLSKSTNTADSKSSPNGGFLPFDLQLTLDGLSGMKIYQKYTIDTAFLPSNYPTSLNFLLKGITNTISNNEWTTTLESFAIPANPFGSEVGQSTVAIASGNSRDASRGTASTPATYYQSNLPESQAKKRAVLTRILDDGTQTLGILEIFDSNAKNVIYRLATVELPYKNNKNGKSAVPTDTYLVNSRQTSKHGKHFWLVGGSKGNWKYIPGSNNSNREWVLIHTAPKAPGWLAGCIGPGPQFDFNTLNAKGNPNGVGTKYLNPALAESTSALNKLVGTLYNDKGFKLEIKNILPVLPTSIKDNTIKTLAADARYKDLFKGI